MATVALDQPATHSPEPARRGFLAFLRAAYEAFVEAQRMRAETYANGYLMHLTDRELAERGISRAQTIRTTRDLMSVF